MMGGAPLAVVCWGCPHSLHAAVWLKVQMCTVPAAAGAVQLAADRRAHHEMASPRGSRAVLRLLMIALLLASVLGK